MTEKIKAPEDDSPIRCPRLGHTVAFSYCVKENYGLPCFKTLDCWFQYFPVQEYLKEKLTDDEWNSIFEKQSKTKVHSLLEIIEQAKKNADNNRE